MPTIFELIEKVKREMYRAKVGMIVTHEGIVRGTSREGFQVEYLDIDVDFQVWEIILEEMRAQKGIVAVEADIITGRRYVGQELLLVVIAGDFREHVFPVLEKTVNRLKNEAIFKKEKLLSG
ncbi:MAG: molybdenum cofactor biosynthesis protein MoaE [Candidatus Hermodarchaeota archaeon]